MLMQANRNALKNNEDDRNALSQDAIKRNALKHNAIRSQSCSLQCRKSVFSCFSGTRDRFLDFCDKLICLCEGIVHE